MVLELKNIFMVEGSFLDFDYQIDLSGYEYDPNFFPFFNPIRVKGSVFNHVGVVKLSANIEFSFQTQCDRCASDITEGYSIPINTIFVKQLNNENNDDFIIIQDDKFNLDEQVKDFILLNLPTKHLCKTDCKGLCPKCGKNLNEDECTCKTVDPRLEVLK
jgi:uncharacterized protein